MDFGDVFPGTSPSLQIRICDAGGSVLEQESRTDQCHRLAYLLTFRLLPCQPPRGRLLRTWEYDNSSNTNGLCQTVAQLGKYIFAGTDSRTEYWKSDTPPLQSR